MTCRAWCATPPGMGGVAIIDLAGDVESILGAIAPPGPWPIGDVCLRDFASIDHGLVVRLAHNRAQLTPHGGPHLVRRISEALSHAGAEWLLNPPSDAYSEATSSLEASMLHAIAQAQSPAAIELLLDQPSRWARDDTPLSSEDLLRSERLNRLINPPIVAVIGPPNVGKSTLLNALVGRSAAIVSDEPGTTRDHVGIRLSIGGVVVDWIDMPGVRSSSDEIEQEAIRRATRLLEHATLVVRLFAPNAPPAPQCDGLNVLCVVNKADLDGAATLAAAEEAVLVSALRGEGLDLLSKAIGERLVPQADRRHPDRWDFPGRA